MQQTSTAREAMLTLLADKLAQLPPRKRIAMLLTWGVPAEDVIGIPTCADHRGWHLLAESQGLTFDGNTMWCKGCYRWVQR